jgi:GH43 family beta-xylosidase
MSTQLPVQDVGQNNQFEATTGNHTSSTLLVETGADPWVIKHKNAYYYCYCIDDRVLAVNKALRLADIGLETKIVWAADDDDPLSEEVWAPELHRINNKWYIYFTAGKADAHRMYVLESITDDPQGEYTFKGKISDSTDRWAIDGTVIKIKDQDYFVWSGWERNTDGRQNLYIANMKNPWTISGKRHCISRAEYDWELATVPDELRGPNARLPFYAINEAPQALRNGEKLYIIFSASHTVTGSYCLGQLSYKGGDPLHKQSWHKHPEPVFCKTDKLVSPGHASFMEDEGDYLIIYHTTKYANAGFDRQVLAQRFDWRADGSPNFGSPLLPASLTPTP